MKWNIEKFKIMANREKYQNITEDAFRFIKYRCGYCEKIMRTNRNFCSIECKLLYFKKLNEIRIGTWTSKKTQSKRHVYRVSDILNEENLKQMVDEIEKNIDVRMNKSKR